MFFRFCLFLFFLITSCTNNFAQIGRFVPDSFIDSMKARGADTILHFEEYTLGKRSMIVDSLYDCYRISYLLWKMNGKTCLQKFGGCFDIRAAEFRDVPFETAPVCIDSSVVHDYIGANLSAITDSQIFPYVLKESIDGRDYYRHPGYGSHPTAYIVWIYLEDTAINLELPVYDARKDHSILNEDGSRRYYRENVNYNWNTSTALYKLIDLINGQIGRLEERKLFVNKYPLR